MIAPARVAAYETVRAVSAGRADLPHALSRARARLTDERDRALAGEIATGTIRWQGAFDRIVAEFSGRAVGKLDPEVLDVLRITIFQLLHLDRVPASAAVNDAVNLARKSGKTSAAPLVNALLRRVSRERERLPLPVRPDSGDDRQAALDYLSVTLSHPRWVAERWLDRHGFEAAEAWARFDNAPAALTIRANRLKTTTVALGEALGAQGVQTRPARFAPDGLIVEAGNPLSTPVYANGLFVVQDEASQLVALLPAVRAGERVLDACASPGGKTTAMAAAMEDRGLIVATDVRGRRVDLLAHAVTSSGAQCIRVVRADASQGLPIADRSLDCVLVDAPCSGLGTIRRDPDIRWKRGPDDFAALSELQLRILDRAAAALKPGGRLIYSTCSSEPEENEDAVERFLSAHPEFAAGSTAAAPQTLHRFIDAAGYVRTLPFRDQLEAFFAAMLVKTKDLR